MSGCSAAWLARLTGGQKVASSNLAIPTICSVYGILDTTFGPAEIPFFISLLTFVSQARIGMLWSTLFEKTAKNQFFCCCTRVTGLSEN